MCMDMDRMNSRYLCDFLKKIRTDPWPHSERGVVGQIITLFLCQCLKAFPALPNDQIKSYLNCQSHTFPAAEDN